MYELFLDMIQELKLIPLTRDQDPLPASLVAVCPATLSIELRLNKNLRNIPLEKPLLLKRLT
jgi:hypothetical protein